MNIKISLAVVLFGNLIIFGQCAPFNFRKLFPRQRPSDSEQQQRRVYQFEIPVFPPGGRGQNFESRAAPFGGFPGNNPGNPPCPWAQPDPDQRMHVFTFEGPLPPLEGFGPNYESGEMPFRNPMNEDTGPAPLPTFEI